MKLMVFSALKSLNFLKHSFDYSMRLRYHQENSLSLVGTEEHHLRHFHWPQGMAVLKNLLLVLTDAYKNPMSCWSPQRYNKLQSSYILLVLRAKTISSSESDIMLDRGLNSLNVIWNWFKICWWTFDKYWWNLYFCNSEVSALVLKLWGLAKPFEHQYFEANNRGYNTDTIENWSCSEERKSWKHKFKHFSNFYVKRQTPILLFFFVFFFFRAPKTGHMIYHMIITWLNHRMSIKCS